MFVDEFDALRELTVLRLVIGWSIVGALTWALAVALPLAIRIAWQLGSDPHRRLELARAAARGLAPIVGLFGLAQPFFVRAPALTLIGAAVLAGLALLAAPQGARNLAAGLGLILRGRPRLGDRVRIGAIEGVVDDVLLTRVALRTREGGLTMLPSADFARLPVTIGSRGAANPIELVVELDPEQPLDDAALARLRRALWFSPLRRAGSEVALALEGSRLRVAIDSWAAQGGPEQVHHLRALVRRAGSAPAPAAAHDEDDA